MAYSPYYPDLPIGVPIEPCCLCLTKSPRHQLSRCAVCQTTAHHTCKPFLIMFFSAITRVPCPSCGFAREDHVQLALSGSLPSDILPTYRDNLLHVVNLSQQSRNLAHQRAESMAAESLHADQPRTIAQLQTQMRDIIRITLQGRRSQLQGPRSTVPVQRDSSQLQASPPPLQNELASDSDPANPATATEQTHTTRSPTPQPPSPQQHGQELTAPTPFVFPTELAFPQDEYLEGYEETLHEVLQPHFLTQLETIQQILQPTDQSQPYRGPPPPYSLLQEQYPTQTHN